MFDGAKIHIFSDIEIKKIVMVNNTAERDNEKMAGWVAHCRAHPRQPSFPLPVGGKGKVLLRRTHSPNRMTVGAVDSVAVLGHNITVTKFCYKYCLLDSSEISHTMSS